MSSDITPWGSEYEFTDLPNSAEVMALFKKCGQYALDNDIRLSFHPGQFCVLASPKEKVVLNAISDLELHGRLMDAFLQPRSHLAKINIHLGGAYGDKVSAMERFCKNFHRLPDSVKSRLTVENDDKASMYSVVDLYEGVYKVIGIPIVFDYHHHRFCTGGLTEEDALEVAISTWPTDIVPVVHYSESRSKEQLDESIRPQAHSDYVLDYIDTYGNRVDIMIEAKAKELAVMKYKELHGLC